MRARTKSGGGADGPAARCLRTLVVRGPGEVEVLVDNEIAVQNLTKMAQQNLIERGMKNVSKYDDEEAARIILQEWLDRTAAPFGEESDL